MAVSWRCPHLAPIVRCSVADHLELASARRSLEVGETPVSHTPDFSAARSSIGKGPPLHRAL
jgi:hypothetical protein